MNTTIPTNKKSIEEIMEQLNYSSYKVQRDLGIDHDTCIRFGIGSDDFKKKYELVPKQSAVREWEVESLSYYDDGERIWRDKIGIARYLEGDARYKECKIHSVKRLSDNSVWMVGDYTQYGKINGFEITQSSAMAVSAGEGNNLGAWSLKDLSSIRVPLFKTADSVDIFEGDWVWWVTNEFKVLSFRTTKNDINTHLPSTIYYSTEEKANEYVFERCPILSYEDVKTWVKNSPGNHSQLIQLVQSKLNQK